MKKWIIILGIILIAAGTLVYLSLSAISNRQTMTGQEAMTILPGSSDPRSYHLPFDATVIGTIDQVQGQTTNDIDFYVFDKTNYQSWISKQPSVWYIKIYRATSNDPFSFTTDKEDDYYFVFDNPGVLFNGDRVVNWSWSASWDYKPYASYAFPAGILLGIAGVVILSYELMKLNSEKRKMEKSRTCPNCNRFAPIDKPVCPHCGFDVANSIRCKYCNGFYDRSLTKCPNCGAKKS